MSFGILAINNNSDQVSGTNTSFTVDLKVNDFIAVPSGGVTYTMVVKAITSDTALTITRPFSGPNVTGANWAAIPAGTMVGVTAKIADDTSYTMRMYVNEATNWMNLLTVDGDVTVYAPDGSSYTGPSWLKLSRIMGTLDMPTLTTIAAQIHADAVQVASDTQTTAANTATATQAAQTATTAARSASQAAQTATTKAGKASASAITAKNEADRAATANPDNQLKKFNNLSDVDSIPQAQINLKIDRVIQNDLFTLLRAPDNTRLVVANNKDIQFQDLNGVGFGLPVNAGGTGATTAAGARTNLQVFKQTDTELFNTNLNSLFEPGVHKQPSNRYSIFQNGYPYTAQKAGVLTIKRSDAHGPQGVTQEYMPYGEATGGALFRNYNASKNKWVNSDWGAQDGGWCQYLTNNGIVVIGKASSQPEYATTNWDNIPANHIAFGYSTGTTNGCGFTGTVLSFANVNFPEYPIQMAWQYGGPAMAFRSRNGDTSKWNTWAIVYSNKNTTIDANGFVKAASPIVKLKGDGTAELNEEAEGVTVERLGVGVYKVSGVLGFHSDPIWGGTEGGYVIPQNGNGLPLLWVDYSVEANGDITLRTYHRTHPTAPSFASNLIGIKDEEGNFTETVKEAEPVDIPNGRWIDLRVEMPSDSIYNLKIEEMRKQAEKVEAERKLAEEEERRKQEEAALASDVETSEPEDDE